MSAPAKIPDHGLAHRDDELVRPTRRVLRNVRREELARRRGQLILDLDDGGRRSDVRRALTIIGQDPKPDERYSRSRVCQRAVHEFPAGMTLAEVGFVLGMHKQTVAKVEARALEKLRAALKMSREDARAFFAASDAARDHWDDMEDET